MRSIFLAWMPLAAMWVLMAVEQPGIAAVIARLPEVTRQLAIFGVVLSLAMVIESPIIQMLSAGATLGSGKNNYSRLLLFMHVLGGGLTLLHLVVGLTPIFDFLILRVVGLPRDYLGDARTAFLCMTPWTAMVGYRRLWQGVLIRRGLSRVIPAIMAGRLGTSALILASGLLFSVLPGSVLGGIALTAGVTVGAAGSFFSLRHELGRMPEGEEPLGYLELFRFYYPLALTSFINLAARPILAVGIARAALPIESLAVWPVVMGFIFLFNAIALSYQEIVITLIDEPGARKLLKSFAVRMGILLLVAYALVLVTPLKGLWFRHISGLNDELIAIIPEALILLAVSSPILAAISYNRGVLIVAKRTGTVGQGVAINLFALVGLMAVLLAIPGINGVFLAAASFVGANSAEALFLGLTRRGSSART